MGLQFILGNAGGGKTWYIEHQAAAMASKDMKRQIFVVVPEQFTMQTQRNLVALSERHGLWNIEVQSFPRLAFRVFGETGAGMAPVIDDLGKTMILKKVLMGLQDQLTYFGRNIHKKGYVAEIKSFLSELMQYDIASPKEAARTVSDGWIGTDERIGKIAPGFAAETAGCRSGVCRIFGLSAG